MLTPVERHGAVWMKRDDTFRFGDATGGKARAISRLIENTRGIVAAGNGKSSQILVAALVAQHVGKPARIHTAALKQRTEIVERVIAAGAVIHEHRPGYLSVLRKRAIDDAAVEGLTLIPWGLECPDMFEGTGDQVRNLPGDMRRLVVPVGSGSSLVGILHGIDRHGVNAPPILAVTVGADPTARLDRCAPGWRERVTLVESGLKFDRPANATEYAGVVLDPLYEAKCVPFLQPDDCLWVVGRTK